MGSSIRFDALFNLLSSKWSPFAFLTYTNVCSFIYLPDDFDEVEHLHLYSFFPRFYGIADRENLSKN